MKPGIKIWLEKEGKDILGGGRYRLLKAIQEEGSLKKAAEKLHYSYRYAWGNIRKMEERLGAKLIVSHKGGSGGGDSRLTEDGKWLLKKYEAFCHEIEQAAHTVFERIFKDDRL
ncbi:MAG TPA: LysR family transcriptional regulator [Firmicutes bacterium]|nr:LysR family transcriptional regulator [Bacillota bacterium]